jgi:hypothetical protein
MSFGVPKFLTLLKKRIDPNLEQCTEMVLEGERSNCVFSVRMAQLGHRGVISLSLIGMIESLNTE